MFKRYKAVREVKWRLTDAITDTAYYLHNA